MKSNRAKMFFLQKTTTKKLKTKKEKAKKERLKQYYK